MIVNLVIFLCFSVLLAFWCAENGVDKWLQRHHDKMTLWVIPVACAILCIFVAGALDFVFLVGYGIWKVFS